MKDQRITIPENTRVIIDGDVIIFEGKEKQRQFESGKWYKSIAFGNIILCVNPSEFVGQDRIEEWCDNLLIPIIQRFEEADMSIVTRLLIGEAEKRGFKGSHYHHGNVVCNTGTFLKTIFNKETGKWAEIIPEKKLPIYTNMNTKDEFFEGDSCFIVNVDGMQSVQMQNISWFGSFKDLAIKGLVFKSGKECHQYLADNWDELNK